ncbi:MAG TPA: Ppx/GppA phosphatase family protein [Mycobacteriales bacterium]|nr:Ppx/GppA phosphatase family protein [Mycobacteriales bacterium]
MTRVAAVDCGTNSVRLLVADAVGDTLVEVVRRMEITRLGQGVDATSRLAPEALERTGTVLRRYAEDIARLGAERVRVAATSATRDAANRADFEALVRVTVGVVPEVISGEEEARLSFAGAVRGLAGGAPPYLVCDIGGGSTELVLGGGGAGAGQPGAEEVVAACSMNVGCVRLAERHLRADPPTAAQVSAAEADVRAALAEAREKVPVERTATMVGVAGSITTVAALALGLAEYDPAKVHHSRLSAARIDEVTTELLASTHAERAARAVIHPGRIDVITAGALVLRVLVAELGVPEVVVSEHDILDGIAWSIA